MFYIKSRLLEASTWIGLLNLCVAFALIKLTTEQREAVESLVYILFSNGMYGMVAPDFSLNKKE